MENLVLSPYQTWIATWLKSNNAYGNCFKAVEAMAEAFPELTKVPGHAETLWGRRAHWWLTTPSGEIVDPTSSQFPGGAIIHYEPWIPGSLCRIGVCYECGDEIWEAVDDLENPPRKSFCSPVCHNVAMAELNSML